MTATDALALGTAMVLLAALPSASVALVIARSASAGTAHGVAVAIGIVTGDLCFVLIATSGLSALAGTLGDTVELIKLPAGVYLFWLGALGLVSESEPASEAPAADEGYNLAKSYSGGLLLTLVDLKAIVFYASFFPAFVDLREITVDTILAVVAITAVCVGSVKIGYALAANRVAVVANNHGLTIFMRRTVGLILCSAGAWLAVQAVAALVR